MGERSLLGRAILLSLVMSPLAVIGGCADGTGPTMPGRDGGRMDTGVSDVGAVDANLVDTNPTDAGQDTGPDAGHTIVGTCEACTSDADCDAMSYCAHLVTGEHACLPGCDSEFPMCPRGFTCIFDATGTGVHANICAPVGGPCCVDEDADHYGVGVGCMGPDCNDMNAVVHPDRDEICDGLDTNCNSHVDEDPNDCGSGRCTPDGDGTYTATLGAMCTAATCVSGTNTDCMLYTCHDGGAMGTTCATLCAPAGTDDDMYCIATAHCDTNVCVPDVPNGGTCDEDSDCTSSHCDNGYCCGSGTCCASTADCPGGGTPTRICDDPTHCQGHHGVVTCMSNTCTAMSGIDDDTACDSSVMEASCGLNNPLFCNGMDPQTARTCPTSCVTDADCVLAAHCAVGICIPDLPPGGPCGRNQDCQDGLTCVDSVCCMTACNGTCEACNLPGMAGSCTAIPAGGDPSGECAGFSCSGYYDGFTSGADVCYRRSDVSDAAAVCDGARMCRGPDLLCPTQPRGPIQVDCNDTCQAARSGTCTGTTAGVCDNLDNPAIMTMCGMGDCLRSVQACVSGAPNTCTPGTPMVETCDGRDNDCNGTIDNGGASLCPAQPHVATQVCTGTGGCAIASMGCSTGYADYDMMLSDGCECDVSVGADVCTAAASIGSIPAPGSVTRMGNIRPGSGGSWFTATFTPSGRPGGGSPTITVAPAGQFRVAVYRDCMGGDYACGAEGAGTTSSSGGLTSYSFTDTPHAAVESWTVNATPWPTTVYIQVTRIAAPATCADAAFSLTVTR